MWRSTSPGAASPGWGRGSPPCGRGRTRPRPWLPAPRCWPEPSRPCSPCWCTCWFRKRAPSLRFSPWPCAWAPASSAPPPRLRWGSGWSFPAFWGPAPPSPIRRNSAPPAAIFGRLSRRPCRCSSLWRCCPPPAPPSPPWKTPRKSCGKSMRIISAIPASGWPSPSRKRAMIITASITTNPPTCWAAPPIPTTRR